MSRMQGKVLRGMNFKHGALLIVLCSMLSLAVHWQLHHDQFYILSVEKEESTRGNTSKEGPFEGTQ